MQLSEEIACQPVTLCTYIDGPMIGENTTLGQEHLPKHLPSIIEYEDSHLFVERLAVPKRMVVCGCGHVGAAVYDLCQLLGYPVTMIDDRPFFANPQRFANAQVICAPFAEALATHAFGKECCMVIATNGHSFDQACLAQALGLDLAYIGMIGSGAKVAYVRKQLLEQGVDPERLASVCAPIGLDIGANTPAEIAVSIMAQVIQLTGAGKHVGECPIEVLQAIDKRTQPGIEVLIVRHGGSAPRGAGSRMFVTADTVVGTIGGGSVEGAAIVEARRMLNGSLAPHTANYDLSNAAAAELGMVCGGSVQVLFIPRS